MNDVGVIDRFLDVFSRYIDSGFGLLGGEVAFLTATLVLIDMTLAGLFWAMSNASGGGGDEVIAKLIKKVLYVGAFAYIIGNFNALAGIVFRSFAGLGLTASGSALTQAQLLQPGRLAQVGIDAGRPIMTQIGDLTGFPEIFANLDVILVLGLAWLVVIVSFFVLAVQLFVTLIEFKLTTLAGFVLVPFALWNKTSFLAERVLGNVVSSGIKVLVLAVIVGIGTGLFGEFTAPPGTEPSIDHALTIMLASLALFGLGIFGPGIAPGLQVSPYQVMAGTIIPAALVTGINSDLPGQVIANVTEAVYDTASGRYLLIPQGSRLIGRYDSQVAFGQRRVLLVWTRLILPDTSSVALDRLPGIDPAGYAGLEDGVDWHWDRILAGAALSTLLGVGAELAAPETRTINGGTGERVIIAGRESAQDTVNQVGQEITKRNLSVQPTLTIRPGFPMRVMVNKDLILRPYQPLFFQRGSSQ